jgi:hypothetical protein
MRNSLPLVVTVAFSVVGVVGDYLLKLTREKTNPLRSAAFYLGFAGYASTAFGWVYVMRHLKPATVGAVCLVSMVPLPTGVGVFAFRQPLHGPHASTDGKTDRDRDHPPVPKSPVTIQAQSQLKYTSGTTASPGFGVNQESRTGG